jgi:hypothetical protein
VALLTVVVRVLPFTSIVVEAMNPVPVAVTLRDDVFTGSTAGLRFVIVGAGLSTSKFTGAPVPLLTDPFITTTASRAPVAIWAAGITAVSFTLLTKVVLSLLPFTWITEVEMNPVPFTASVTGPEPAVALVGLIDGSPEPGYLRLRHPIPKTRCLHTRPSDTPIPMHRTKDAMKA